MPALSQRGRRQAGRTATDAKRRVVIPSAFKKKGAADGSALPTENHKKGYFPFLGAFSSFLPFFFMRISLLSDGGRQSLSAPLRLIYERAAAESSAIGIQALEMCGSGDPRQLLV